MRVPLDPDLFEAMVFDLDGLLVDTEKLWPRAEIEVFATVGVDLTFAECRQTMGMRLDDVVTHWRLRRGWHGPSDEEVAASVASRVVELIEAEATPMPDAVETVEWLASSGYTLAVASSSWESVIRAALDVLGLRDRFSVIHSAQHDQHGKPHPAVYLRTCAALGVDPQHTLAFEDSVAGTRAAVAATMTCVAVPYDRPADPAFATLADHTVERLGEVDANLLRQLSRR